MLGGIDAVAGGFSWLGAKMFCEWKGMRLPTEAQWEAAARGQTMHEYPCGSDIWECQWGLYDCHGACSMWFDESVGQCCYPWSPDQAGEGCLSPFGVNGMYGNAGEWIADEADNDHSSCANGCVDPEPEEVDYTDCHLLKGGYTQSPAKFTRISWREAAIMSGSAQTGVRCVRPDEPIPQPDSGF